MEDPTTRAKEAGELVLVVYVVVYVTVVVAAIGVSLSPLYSEDYVVDLKH